MRAAVAEGRVQLRFRHRVDGLVSSGGMVTGVRGAVLEPSQVDRGRPSSRVEVGDFEISAQAVVVTSGGIGGDHDLVRKAWPERLGEPPRTMVAGVPAHVDGRMLGITAEAGGRIINPDRMWHYVEGLQNWDPVWENHGIRVLPGPSSLWLDATGKRLPAPYYPGFDTLGTLRHLRGHRPRLLVVRAHPEDHREGVRALRLGAEPRPDRQGHAAAAQPGALRGAGTRSRRSSSTVPTSSSRTRCPSWSQGMNALTGDGLIDLASLRHLVETRDREMDNAFTKDLQIAALRSARAYRGDRLVRVASPHKMLDPRNGPLIAVRLHVLTRKTLGGLETDLDGRVLTAAGYPLPGVYAAGEVSGFGGGGMHGYNSLEGTFLGGCLFSGRQAGRAAARAVG